MKIVRFITDLFVMGFFIFFMGLLWIGNKVEKLINSIIKIYQEA
jgi:hypothetical protein